MKIKNKIILFLCMVSSSLMSEEIINLYTYRNYDSDKMLYSIFTKKTGIKVRVVTALENELIMRLQNEGLKSPADILIVPDAGSLYRAKKQGLLQQINSEYINKAVPEYLKDKDNFWFGISKRARIIVYAKDRISSDDLISYEDLAYPKWKNKIMIRSSKNTHNQSLLASMIASSGEEKTKVWARNFVKNFVKEPEGDDKHQVKAVANGVGDIAIVDSHCLGEMLTSKNAQEVSAAKKVGIFFPNQHDRGTHINISGAGITKSSKNKENAIKFLEFLLSIEAQKVFTEVNFEFPVVENINKSKLLVSWGNFLEDSLPVEKFGQYNSKAVKIFNEVGWE